MDPKKKVVIVGAGFGGLSAACLLGRAGFDVTVLEKNRQNGGRARIWEENGFVFDMGPSWYLMPEVFTRFFTEFDRYPEQFFKLVRLDPNYRVFFGHGQSLDVPADPVRLEGLFEGLETDGREKLRRYLKTAKTQYDIAMKDFMYRDYRSVTDFLTWKTITRGSRLHLFENIDKFVKRYFHDPRVRKIMEYTMVFLGGSPKTTPALYAIMSHVDFDLGVWYPLGGFGKIVRALETIAKDNGVRILNDQCVTGIRVDDGQARSVLTGRSEFPADIAVVNADYRHAETELLPDRYRTYPERYWSKRTMGPSAFIVYLGLNKKVERLLHHNLYLDPSWDDHFRKIFDAPDWPENFSYYVSCPSKTDPTVAPSGGENLFILVPVAPGLPDDEAIRGRFYDLVMDRLSGLVDEDLRPAVTVKRIFSIRDFQADYNAYLGTALGMSHTLLQTAAFRPRHRSRKVSNLYYVGNYTHPGVGLPMVLISGQLVSAEIRNNHA